MICEVTYLARDPPRLEGKVVIAKANANLFNYSAIKLFLAS